MAGPGRVVAEAPGRVAGWPDRILTWAGSVAALPAPLRAVPCRSAHGCIVAECRAHSLAVSWLGLPAVSRYKIWLLPFPSRNTVQCITIHCSLLPAPFLVTIQYLYRDLTFFSAARPTSLPQYNPPQSRYTWCIVTQKPTATLAFSHSACHNTIIVL